MSISRSLKKIQGLDLKYKILLIVGLPQLVCLAIFWPGFIQYDHLIEIASAGSSSPVEWHSLLWAYLSRGIMFSTGTIGVYGLLQIAAQILMVMYSILTLRRLEIINNRASIILALIYGLSPCFIMYGLMWQTDTLFALLMMMLSILMIEYAKDHSLLSSRKWIFMIIITTFFLIQFRKNAILIPIIIGIILIVTSKKIIRSSIIAIIPLLISSLISLFFSMLGVIPSPVQELLSVPAQQVGLVAHENGPISENDKREFEKVRSLEKWKTEYLETDADPLKKGITDSTGFMKAWWNTGLKNPGLYVKAWWNLMYPYWQVTVSHKNEIRINDINDDFNEFQETSGRSKTACLQDGYACYSGTDVEKIIALGSQNNRTEWLSGFYDWAVYDHIPIISDLFTLVFFNNALPLRTLIICFILSKRRKDWIVIFLPAVYIMISLLAFSPISTYRYSLELYWVIPIIIAWTLHSRIQNNHFSKKITNDPKIDIKGFEV
jgi:hypothetical protein